MAKSLEDCIAGKVIWNLKNSNALARCGENTLPIAIVLYRFPILLLEGVEKFLHLKFVY